MLAIFWPANSTITSPPLRPEKRPEILIEFGTRSSSSGSRDFEPSFLRQHGLAGVELKGYRKILAERLQAGPAKIIREPFGRGLRGLGARHAAIAIFIGKPFHFA